MTLLLAPMEGLLDFVLRDVLTRVGGVDRCVSEFIRITGTLLPDKVFLRYLPELRKSEYNGVTAKIAFQENGELKVPLYTLSHYIDGKKTPIGE